MNKQNKESNSNELPWINPIGGLGDTLMLSGVLKKVNEDNPESFFNLVRRKDYGSILKGHPAIKKIGNPPVNAKIVTSDYWNMEKLGGGNQRAYQILARSFGLKTPIEEKLFIPDINNFNNSEDLKNSIQEDILLYEHIPWKDYNVLISPSSESPRKESPPGFWHNLVEKMISKNILVLQSGRKDELHIKNTFSVIGLTNPRQLIDLVRRVNLIICADNFIMHAAYLTEKPAIVIWGPTSAETYGYPNHIKIQAPLSHCDQINQCLGPDFPHNYNTPCPLKENHCMNKISTELIFNYVLDNLI